MSTDKNCHEDDMTDCIDHLLLLMAQQQRAKRAGAASRTSGGYSAPSRPGVYPLPRPSKPTQQVLPPNRTIYVQPPGTAHSEVGSFQRIELIIPKDEQITIDRQ